MRVRPMPSTDHQRNLDAFYSLSSARAEVLREVYERTANGCLDSLVLVFTTKVLVLWANEDDDTISVRSKRAAAFSLDGDYRESRSLVLRSFIGKAFGWGWITVNQQGYCDGALLSFDGLTPGILLAVAASCIEISRVTPQENAGTLRIEVVENGKYSVKS